LRVEPAAVRRVRCRFAGMVTMPCTLAVHASREGDELLFDTRNELGAPVIERGSMELGEKAGVKLPPAASHVA
jgi:hypothetical protein